MLIGICGAAGSGKSTVARLLVEEHDFTRKPFAFRLKSMLSALGVPANILDGTPEQKNESWAALDGKTPRHAMQTLGTEWGRDCMGKDFWVNLWARDYVSLPNTTRIVADDVRFPNEVSRIRELGGIVVRIVRPGAEKVAADHASEKSDELSVSFTLINAGDLEDLRKDVRQLVNNFSWALEAIA